MRVLAFVSLLLPVLVINNSTIQTPSFHIEEISPFNKAVPGLIVEARVEGLSDSPTMMIDSKDVSIELTQDGNKFKITPRTATNMFISKTPPEGGGPGTMPDFTKMKALWSFGFVVPKGLHPGEVDVVVVYSKLRSETAKLLIETQPSSPMIGSTSVERISIAQVSPGRTSSDFGLRLERGNKAPLHVHPLVDPDDPQAAVVVSFKQGEQELAALTSV